MHELPPDHKENSIEHIPTPEEVLGIFKQLIGEVTFSEKRKLEDEQGLLLWDITLPEQDGSGSVEYLYMRKGNYSGRGLTNDLLPETRIDVLFVGADGIPISGHSVAKLAGDRWKIAS